MTLTLKNSNKSFEPNEYLNWPLTLYIRPSATTGRLWIIASTSVILTKVILVIYDQCIQCWRFTLIIANTAFEKHVNDVMVFAVMKLFNWMDIPHTVNYCWYPMTHLKFESDVTPSKSICRIGLPHNLEFINYVWHWEDK